MNNYKVYERRARLYPVIVSMLPPLILLILFGSKIASLFTKLEEIWNIAIAIIPATAITGALTYGLKTLARTTSKFIFQFPLFLEDESKMPTTELLLWKNKSLSKKNKAQIHDNIKNNVGLELMNHEEEQADESEARLLIVDAVKQIRERTRDNLILFNYNCNFGFIRNYMGANIWALLIVICLGVINYINPTINQNYIFLAGIFILVSFPISFLILKQIGREYARQLYTAFLELK